MHETPSDEIFNEMKEIAIRIWNTYDNTYGYVDEKLNKINSIENYEDNAMVFYRMFDFVNQNKFLSEASEDVIEYMKQNK